MLNPLMLLGLLGLSVPVIIHLIQKQRLKPQPLATLQFLDKEDVANAFAPVPRDPVQLLLRLLLLLAFILLMSRLTCSSGDRGPRSTVIILDQSMSMRRPVAGKPLFEHHKAQAQALIDAMKPADSIALYLVGDELVTETGFLSDPAALREQLSQFQVGDSGGRAILPTVLEAVNQLRARREANAAVVLFSDLQASDYSATLAELEQDPQGSPVARFRDHHDPAAVQIFLVDEAPPVEENLAIRDARMLPPSVFLGAGGRYTAEVVNYGDEAAEATVTLREGATDGEQRSVMLQPGEVATLDLVHRFESPVDVAVSLELPDDDLVGDNHFYQPVRMKARKQILLVTPGGSESVTGDLGYSGEDLLSYALNPSDALGQGSDTYIALKRVSANMLERVSLPLYSTVILYGIGEISDQSAKDLRAFAANGGGVMLVLTPDLSPLRVNDSMQLLLGGLSVGQIKEPAEPIALSRGEGGVQHPVLLPLLRGEWGDLDGVHLMRYNAVESLGSARAVLRAANDDIVAAWVPIDRGAVYVQLFSFDLSAGSLPRSTAFVPMLQTLTNALGVADRVTEADSIRAGEIRRVETPEYRGLTGDVSLVGPSTKTLPLDANEGESVLVQGLWQAGAYELSHPQKASGRKRWVTVNPVLGESDVTALTTEQVGLIFGADGASRGDFASAQSAFRERRELLPWLLVLVVLALLLEGAVGAWSSRSGQHHAKRPDAAGEGAI